MAIYFFRCPKCRQKIINVPCFICGKMDYRKVYFVGLVCNGCGRNIAKGLICPNDGTKIQWWRLKKVGLFASIGRVILIIFFLILVYRSCF